MYATKCQSCGVTSHVRLSFEDYDQFKEGEISLRCVRCEGLCGIEFDPGNVSFVLHDGESGGWASKALKENKYRARRAKVMTRRQRDHAPRTKLLPNFGGELAPTWKDARDEAYDVALTETKDPVAAKEAAATYDSLVRREVTG
jgi:hypothetical protein